MSQKPDTVEQILDDVYKLGKTDQLFNNHDYQNLQAGIRAKLDAYYGQQMLELVGEDEKMATAEFGLSSDDVFMPTDYIRSIKNDLRGKLRQAIQERFLKDRGSETK